MWNWDKKKIKIQKYLKSSKECEIHAQKKIEIQK